MISWAIEEQKLQKPVKGSKSGLTEKAHLMAVWEVTGTQPPELTKWLDRPTEVMYLWDWLCELVFPLSFSELEAWQRLTHRELSRFEVDAMILLDRVRAT